MTRTRRTDVREKTWRPNTRVTPRGGRLSNRSETFETTRDRYPFDILYEIRTRHGHWLKIIYTSLTLGLFRTFGTTYFRTWDPDIKETRFLLFRVDWDGWRGRWHRLWRDRHLTREIRIVVVYFTIFNWWIIIRANTHFGWVLKFSQFCFSFC